MVVPADHLIHATFQSNCAEGLHFCAFHSLLLLAIIIIIIILYIYIFFTNANAK